MIAKGEDKLTDVFNSVRLILALWLSPINPQDKTLVLYKSENIHTDTHTHTVCIKDLDRTLDELQIQDDDILLVAFEESEKSDGTVPRVSAGASADQNAAGVWVPVPDNALTENDIISYQMRAMELKEKLSKEKGVYVSYDKLVYDEAVDDYEDEYDDEYEDEIFGPNEDENYTTHLDTF